MAEIPRSSFIPKESMGMTPERIRRGRTFYIFGFIGTAILIGSLLGAGLVFFLKSSAQSNLDEAQQHLSAQKGLFDDTRVSEVRAFDRRLKAADILIRGHVSPLRVFSALEEKTKQKIQFTSFTFNRTSMSEVLVSLAGQTEAFKTLALQEMGFAGDDLLKNIIFSEVATYDVSKEVEGEASAPARGITFTLTGVVDTSVIRYDGTSHNALSGILFTDNGGELAVVPETEEGAVLGATITNE